MSKYRVTECPGCGLPFCEGRSLSQHFIWSPDCKQQVTALSTAARLESNPCVLHPSTDSSICYSPPDIDDNPYHDIESTGSPSSETSVEYSYPSADSDDPDTSKGVIDSPNMAAEGNLQNVVSFPVAFSNAALHEVQLLKLLHEIGAPNHAFQSLMTWARKADENDCHFQPSPMCYESQIKNLTGLVGMTPCRPKITKVSLEPDDIILDVVVFPFATMLASLINCLTIAMDFVMVNV